MLGKASVSTTHTAAFVCLGPVRVLLISNLLSGSEFLVEAYSREAVLPKRTVMVFLREGDFVSTPRLVLLIRGK